ncbi:signal peptidase I [Enterococcus sp. 5H]|uniref:signal peptidase I n=1 Tax=Enterococcus sp. 5H TaxID=1229490 RepID=UPI002302EB7D|nr:signal peptidase I [Enterococcus sp. 5H]
MRLKKNHSIIKNSVTIFIIICCFLFLFRVKPHSVSGQSMAPTFENNDRIFVTKGKAPIRYDIVTFSPKDKPKESYVKRVVGQPGDTIWFEENKLFINHQMKAQSKVPVNDTDKRAIDLPDGTIKIDVSVAVMNQLKELNKIPEDEYFLLGDNRNHSTDSRMMGLIPKKQIEGVVSFRYYPINKVGFVR